MKMILVPYGHMFFSPSHGNLTLEQVRLKILDFFLREPEVSYRLIIGTDSQPHNGAGVDFVTAVVVHRLGRGGIYFCRWDVKKNIYVIKKRNYQETLLSLETAEELFQVFKDDGITKYDIEIHVDIGPNGKTRQMIHEIVGMVRGSGWDVKIKPDSYAASKIADRYT